MYSIRFILNKLEKIVRGIQGEKSGKRKTNLAKIATMAASSIVAVNKTATITQIQGGMQLHLEDP